MKSINLYHIIFTIIILSFSNSSLSTTYYVSPDGDDSNNGMSISTPWKTITKVTLFGLNSGFSAGSFIKFEGGEIFESDTSFFGAALWIVNSGTINSPIIFTSYGLGRATIKFDETGILCVDRKFIEIRSLNFRSNFNPFNQSGTSFNNNIGILYYNSTNSQLERIFIDSCNFSRILNTGVNFGSDSIGYKNIKISNCKFDSIGHIGFSITNGSTFSFSNYPNKDITIKNCEFSRIKGYKNATNPGTFTGIGIFMVAVDSAMIEKNLVYSCGGLGYEGEGSGPDGIEAARCNKIVFQYNEVYDQKSSSETDGSGLHFGDGVQNSIIQYNYSHNNDGAGINCYSYDGNYPLSDSNNIIRYNICAKNGRSDGDPHGEIEIGGSPPKTTYNIQIYNNTLYATNQNGNDRSVFMLYRNVNGITFRNNIVYSADTSVALFSHYPTGGTYLNIFIQNNAYWSDHQIFKFREGFTFYYNYLSWQNVTGFEKINGVNVGYTEDPLLVNPDDAGNVNNYKTNPGSVTVENGLNLNSLFGINPGIYDFFGTLIPKANKFDIGAYEDTSVFVTVDLTIIIEGFYNSISDTQIGDTVRLYLAEAESPYTIVDVSKSYLNAKGKGVFIFNADILAESGLDHYLVAFHRNSIQTWSSSPVNLHISGSRVYYNFTTDDSQAYGDNMVQKGSKWCVYGGDVNQDGVIDNGDGALVENDAYNIETGFVVTDLNGDQVVDIADQTIVNNNIDLIIVIVRP